MKDVAASGTPDLGGTLFISYARIDDDKPPFDDKGIGWVSFFWQQLRYELRNAGLGKANLWLDRYQIDKTEKFTDKIEDALTKARMIVPVLSPNWVSSDWCKKELDRFVELHQGKTDDNIVLVKKRDTPESTIPEPLRNRVGYQFFEVEPSGGVREFYWRGLKDEAAYFKVLKKMADWVSKRMLTEPVPLPPVRPRLGRTVYVAVPSDELRDAWQRLVNDLKGAGYDVLPAESRLPDLSAKADEFVRNALSASEISIHFLGESEGMKPAESNEGFVRQQLRLAREHAAAIGTFPRFLWAPKWLPGNKSAKRRDPFEVVNRFGGLSAGEEVYGEEVTDLSQWLRGRLDQRKAPPPAAQTIIIAGASVEDDDLVDVLANRLQSDDVKVRPHFADQPASSADWRDVKAALVPWGKADKASIETLLTSVSSHTSQVVVLRMPGGDAIGKRRFVRQGIYSESLSKIPPNRKAARALLVRLEIIPEERADA